MSRRTRVGTAIRVFGVLAAVAAAGLLLVPESVLGFPAVSALVAALAGLDPRRFVLLLSGAVGLLALVLALIRGAGRPTLEGFDEFRERPPEAVTESEAPRSGVAFDRRIAAAVEGSEDGEAAVRERLRSSAVQAYARTTGTDEPAARATVAMGRWTDDATAAAFLAAPGGPSPSLGSRIRLWLDPAAERRRRVEATVAALESLLDGEDDAGERRWPR